MISEQKYKELFSEGRNKILKSLVDSEEFNTYISCDKRKLLYTGLEILDLYSYLKDIINDFNINYSYTIEGFHLWSDEYEFDTSQGICMDNDATCIRYKRLDTNKTYKMKTSKFFHKSAKNLTFIPEVAIHWLAEIVAGKRKATLIEASTYKLCYGSALEDFYRIYSTPIGGSCMRGGDHISFYKNCVDTTAAWIENAEGVLLARCVIYNKVMDEEGNIYRLAERQYADKDYLKDILISKLIEKSVIDGYKKIGAGAKDATLFLTNSGESLSKHFLYIECDISAQDIVSYQDSFKYYNFRLKLAYNKYDISHLGTTELHIKHEFETCPSCGKTLYSKTFIKNGKYYCSTKCLNSLNLIDEYYEYLPKYNKRISVVYHELPENFFIYGDKKYIGNWEVIDNKKVPKEKVIYQLDLKGNILNKYPDVKSATTNIGGKSNSTIIKCLNHQSKTAYKFIWRYASEFEKEFS